MFNLQKMKNTLRNTGKTGIFIPILKIDMVMKTYIILSFLFLLSCNNTSTKKDVPEFDYLSITEYHNEYNDNKLIRVIVTQSETYKGVNAFFNGSKYERIYEYCDGKLKKESEFEIDIMENRILRSTTIYTENLKEEIEWNGSDTVRYQKREFDSEGRETFHKKKHYFSVPDFDFEIADNFEERTKYDENYEVTERIRIDYHSGTTRRELLFSDSLPATFDAAGADIVLYKTIENGDTIKTERYFNGVLEVTALTVTERNITKEFDCDSDNVLTLSRETLELGGERIVEVINFPESHSTHSSFYFKDKEIKSVSISPESQRVTLTEYDEHGNVLKEKEYILFLEKYRLITKY